MQSSLPLMLTSAMCSQAVTSSTGFLDGPPLAMQASCPLKLAPVRVVVQAVTSAAGDGELAAPLTQSSLPLMLTLVMCSHAVTSSTGFSDGPPLAMQVSWPLKLVPVRVVVQAVTSAAGDGELAAPLMQSSLPLMLTPPMCSHAVTSSIGFGDGPPLVTQSI